MARYRVSSTHNEKHNPAYPKRSYFDSSDRRGQEFSGLTSHQLQTIYTSCAIRKKQRNFREDR
ncbi:MAG: hypothetical protein JSU67_11055 [Gammaproteobacteria bacterium]|nr:MAG: hypothetical protein JSU67_11055 [Gammaproteobacteria bacterium]